MNHCIECNAPLSGETRLCSACAEAALGTFEAYQEGDTVEEFKAGFRDILAGRTVSLAELDAYVEGDTEPNATDWQDDCAYDLDTGFCRLAYPNGCPTCPHWQAIGDVAT